MAILKRSDVSLLYELAGSGQPVLLIQGVGVIGECWRPQVAALAKEYQTLIFDNRDIGQSQPCRGPISIESMAEDAQALMDNAGWTSAHVIGHSMGGVIAQQLALNDPSRVRSLSLLCTFGRGKDAARLTPWVLWMTLRTRLGSRGMRRRAFLEMLWPRRLLQTLDADALAQSLAPLLGRDLADQPPVLMKQVRALSRHNTLARLGELTSIRTLVMSAELDPIAPVRYGRELADRIPGARFEVVANAAHGVAIQKAVEVNAMLRRFLAEEFE